MSIADIKTLSLREKLQVMEVIWDDLRGAVEDMDVPPAHKELLDERQERVSSGAATLRDWENISDRA